MKYVKVREEVVYHSMMAEAKESLTKPNKSAKASQVKPHQAPSDLVMKMYNSWPMTMSHQDVLRVIAAPVSPQFSFSIISQLKNAWSTKTTADTHAITNTFL